MEKRLTKEFFLQDTIEVARKLLGMRLVHVLPSGQRLSGFITETEAYLGAEDPACHSFGFRRTERTGILYETGGLAYIYFIYGMYHCLNVVTRPAGEPEAVLIRGLMPLEGIDLKAKTDGPGKLCRALKLTRAQNGEDLRGDALFITEYQRFSDDEIEASPRVGIDYAGDAMEWPLRFQWLSPALKAKIQNRRNAEHTLSMKVKQSNLQAMK